MGGVMDCQKHGRVECMHTCSHIAKQVDAGQMPRGRRLTMLSHLFVCDDCFDSLGMKRFLDLDNLPPEEIWARDDLFDTALSAHDGIEDPGIFCLKCVEELERRSQTRPRAAED